MNTPKLYLFKWISIVILMFAGSVAKAGCDLYGPGTDVTSTLTDMSNVIAFGTDLLN